MPFVVTTFPVKKYLETTAVVSEIRLGDYFL